MRTRPFHQDDEDAVIALWNECGLTRALGYAQEERVSLGKRLIPDTQTKD